MSGARGLAAPGSERQSDCFGVGGEPPAPRTTGDWRREGAAVWDSSAVVPLVALEAQSVWAQGLLRDDPVGIVWALSPVEVRSALVRRHKEGSLSALTFATARNRAQHFFTAVAQVVVLEEVAERARRVLDLHPLRAADALQLAAALVASRERPQDLPFVTLDERLGEAAEREGFPLVSAKR